MTRHTVVGWTDRGNGSSEGVGPLAGPPAQGDRAMNVMKFISVLTERLNKNSTTTFHYPKVVGCDDSIINQIALELGMITLPRGKPNDPSEHWIFAQEEK